MAFINLGVRAMLGLILVGAAVGWDVYRGGVSERIAGSEATRELAFEPPTEELSAVVRGNSEFAVDAYKLLAGQRGGQNLFFSPYSISIALSMAYAGAGGQTAIEMASVIHSSLPPGRYHHDLGTLDLMVGSHLSSHLTFKSANSLWGSDKTRFEGPFLDTLARSYGAAVRLANFAGDPDGSRRRINAWIEDKTDGKVADLLGPNAIDRSASLVLVNAVYFLGRWQDPFERYETWPEAFSRVEGDSIRVQTMHHGFVARFEQSDAYDAVELPYAGGKVAMDIVLPKSQPLVAFEAGLTAAGFRAIIDGLKQGDIDLSMPRFSLAGRAASLKSVLRALGMNLGFDPHRANFSAIGFDPNRPMFLGDLLHDARVTVDEDGTEAAAVTSGELVGAAAPAKTKIHVDHPFFFALRDVPTGMILFLGRVTDPSRG